MSAPFCWRNNRINGKGELQANAHVSEGKEWGGYPEEGVCVCTCVQAAFPGMHLLHATKGNSLPGKAVYMYSGTTVLI